MTKKEMCICTIDKLLTELGWIQVYHKLSGIFQKNHCYFVMYPPKEKMQPLQQSQGTFGVGASLMVHTTDYSWYVEKDGFLLDSGSVPRYLSAAWEYGFDGGDGEKSKKFASSIDSYANMDDSTLMGYKRKEELFSVNGKQESTYKVSNLGIGNTKMFTVSPSAPAQIVKIFGKNIVYCINKIDNGVVNMSQLNGDNEPYTIPLEQLITLESKNAILAIENIEVSSHDTSWTYSSIFQKSDISIPQQFDIFNLSSAQKSVLARAFEIGANFTPLLDCRYTASEMQIILDIARSGCNCECLLGEKIDESQLKILSSIAENGLEVAGFCSANKTASDIQMEYSEFLEGLDFMINSNKINPECASRVRKVASYQHGYQHVLDNSIEKPLLIDLKDKMQFSASSIIAEHLFDNGVTSNLGITETWLTVPDSLKTEILTIFQVPTELYIIDKKWNDYIWSISNKILSFGYTPDGHYKLFLNAIIIGYDYNSVYVTSNSGKVLWRAVYVNQEFYIYHSDLVDNLL